ncbi:sulfatase-like hydrolase/transferase [Allorhodopirellula heiligendammensis]|uniref:Arylsulfatase n=1 Tax=Allorhodopirellula heiligendammensis TaxID=2714739 RepID=A0A5C6C3K5_9BACT|nr:sulfatase-like hydrolase/transferase [Allorhodopirellula heiligendammensis]TWU18191.1 Arylsulfatase precursor [Allorhodopirellula heiligendammensis]
MMWLGIRFYVLLALTFVIAGQVAADERRSGEPIAKADENKPNVVVILADDLGWNSVGYHNKNFPTPNIDRLVREGVELNQFYVAPMCSPTRAGLMTGRYPIRFGAARAVIPPYRDFGLPVSEVTLPERLADLGYANRGVFGKWHLGHRRSKWHPLNQGFTHFHGHYNGAIDYFELTREDVRDWHVDAQPSDEQGYSTHLIADAAAKWITDSSASEAPYFCYVPFNAPHSPFQAPEETIARFDDRNSAKTKGNKPGKARNIAILKAMIWEMDEGVGRILKSIEDSGEANNTIVWFLSDNGGVGSLPRLNSPLRGSKLTVYEGGVRVPSCIRWPDRLAAGVKSEHVCGYIDVLPTIVDAAGGEIIADPELPLDGISLLSGLTSSDQFKSDGRPWYSYHGQSGDENEHLAVLVDGWKLKVNGPQLISESQLTEPKAGVELFHLSTDPNETKNLATDYPDKVGRLGRMLIEYRALQPSDAVPPYGVGSKGFVPPPKWHVDLSTPDVLVGAYPDGEDQQ